MREKGPGSTSTGDTVWVNTLLAAGRYADLLIAKAYWFERKVPFHLDYSTLREKMPVAGSAKTRWKLAK